MQADEVEAWGVDRRERPCFSEGYITCDQRRLGERRGGRRERDENG